MYDPYKIDRTDISPTRPAALKHGKRFYLGGACRKDEMHTNHKGECVRYASDGKCRACQLLRTLEGSRDYRAERELTRQRAARAAEIEKERADARAAMAANPDLFGDL